VASVHSDLSPDSSDDDPPLPIVIEQVERAVAPSAWLLPEVVRTSFGRVVAMVLESHPFGEGLVARLSPGLRVATISLSSDPEVCNLAGYRIGAIWVALMDVIRKRAQEKGMGEFFPPAGSMRALRAFTSYLQYDKVIWRAPEAVARKGMEILCDAVVAALFLGLMEELAVRPASAAAWGDTGLALLQVHPRAHAVLGAALSAMPPRLRSFLEIYQALEWDEARTAKRLHIHPGYVNQRCIDGMRALGTSLRAELSRAAPQVEGGG
jgi:hypothetical protein